MTVFVMLPLLFFVGVMAVFYQSHKWQVIAQAQSYLDNIKGLIVDQLTMLEEEHKKRTSLIAGNRLLKSYIFIVADLEGEPEAFQEQFKELVGPQQSEKYVVITRGGDAIVGEKNKNIINFVRDNLTENPGEKPEVFYFFGQGGMWMVVRSGFFYEEQYMGQIVLGKPLDHDFFQLLKQRSSGDLFLVYDRNIVFATIKSWEKPMQMPDEGDRVSFELAGDAVVIDKIPYRVRLIPIKNPPVGELPDLWIGTSQEKMIGSLNSLLYTSVKLFVVGSIAILGFGALLIYKIVKPIENLVKLTQSVAEGNLPELKEVVVHDEMDYLTERFYSMLSKLKDNQKEIDNVQQLLKRQAITDPMTGLYNRRYFDEILPKLLTFHAREGLTLYILILDIDHFKHINDTYGHPCGDNVLVAFADTLKKSVRDSDFCFRIGGEEFAMLLHAKDLESTLALANNLRTRIERKPVHYWGEVIYCTVSIGVVETEQNVSPEQLIRRADDALYDAKRLGRNRVCVSASS